jgi:hypothetical protein
MKPKNNQPYFVFPPGLSMRSGVRLGFEFANITVSDYRFTLVAVYGPNEDNPVFFKSIF